MLFSLLMQNGADVNAKDDTGWTSLIWASVKGHTDIVKLLLENGSDVNAKDSDGKSPLIMASTEGYTKIVRMLLEKGADVNAKDNENKTALIMANYNRHIHTIIVLKKDIRIKQLREEKLKIALIVKKGLTQKRNELLVPYAQRETIRHIASFF